MANANIKIGSNSYEKVKTLKYLGSLLTNQNSIQEKIKCRLKAGYWDMSFYTYILKASFVFHSGECYQKNTLRTMMKDMGKCFLAKI